MKYSVDGNFNHREFRHKVKDALKDSKMCYMVIAEKTGYSVSAIANYMAGQDSRFIPVAIADVLGIELRKEKKNG